MEESAADRVQRGIALLDERVPGWEWRINRLDMSYSDRCILGQLKGSYKAGLTWLGLEHGYTHGFGIKILVSTRVMDEYRELTHLWRRYVESCVKPKRSSSTKKDATNRKLSS